MTDLSGWLQVTRNVLASRFGNRWSTLWPQAVFIAPSTKVPQRIQEKLTLALKLAGLFTANPSYEVASMDVTAAEATSLRDAAVAAQQAFMAAKVTQNTKTAVANIAKAALRKMMQALFKILGATLAGDDPRWGTFGFNMPASDTTPGQPQNVTASDTGNGAAMVQWDAVPLATRFRVRMLRLGIDDEYLLAARATGTMALIDNIVPGQTALIIVQAVNSSGQQGVASEPIEFTMPTAAAKTAEAPSGVAPLLPEVTTVPTNGSRNGHAEASTPRV